MWESFFRHLIHETVANKAHNTKRSRCPLNSFLLQKKRHDGTTTTTTKENFQQKTVSVKFLIFYPQGIYQCDKHTDICEQLDTFFWLQSGSIDMRQIPCSIPFQKINREKPNNKIRTTTSSICRISSTKKRKSHQVNCSVYVMLMHFIYLNVYLLKLNR